MKMHHFPWLRNRTTEHRKAGKARITKENRRSKEFNTVSKQLVVHHSFQRDNICEQSHNKKLRRIYSSGAFFVRLFADLMMTEKKGAKRLDSRFTKLVARKNGIYNACIHGAFVIRF